MWNTPFPNTKLINCEYTIGGASDFEDGGFYGFRGDFENNNERIQNDREIGMGDRVEISYTYGPETVECQEAQVIYGQPKEELGMGIGLGIGF